MKAVPGRLRLYLRLQRSHPGQALESLRQPVILRVCQKQTQIATHVFVHCDSSQNRRRLSQATRPVSSLLQGRTIPEVNSKDKLKHFQRVQEVPNLVWVSAYDLLLVNGSLFIMYCLILFFSVIGFNLCSVLQN